jgi:hypothetical protein
MVAGDDRHHERQQCQDVEVAHAQQRPRGRREDEPEREERKQPRSVAQG